MKKPVARLGDFTSHGGKIVIPGSLNVFVNKRPIATMKSAHLCPKITPGSPPIPHVGGIAIKGNLKVLANKTPIICFGDYFSCIGPPAKVIQASKNVIL